MPATIHDIVGAIGASHGTVKGRLVNVFPALSLHDTFIVSETVFGEVYEKVSVFPDTVIPEMTQEFAEVIA